MPLKPIPPINPLNILVVDDNALDRAHSVKIIKQSLHYADEVSSGKEAIIAAYENPYDLILMDLDMPGMDGFETTKIIRSLPATRGWVPIIALTQTDNPEDVRQCFQVGMSNFILKPLRTNSLLAAICSYSAHKKNVTEQVKKNHQD